MLNLKTLLPPPNNRQRGFTLIELLVVIAIIAILSVVVILTLNPSELLRQSRDSNRVADLANINESLGIYAEDQGGSFGNASTTYISIPDPSATSTAGDQCQGLGLPTLVPTSTVYHCAASSTYRNPNGTGWIPVNFSSISFGTPLSVLPVDPVNTTSSGDYYAYIPGQSSANTFELIARMESQKYTASSGAAANDGGYSSQYDEVGKDLTLALNMSENLNRISSTDYLSFDQSGLVGYWPLNEGVGSTAIDKSGNGNNGTWNGTQAGSSGYYSPGIVGNWAGAFDGSTNYITTSFSGFIQSFALWYKGTYTLSNNWGDILAEESVSSSQGFQLRRYYNTNYAMFTPGTNSGTDQENNTGPSLNILDGNWHFLVISGNGTSVSEYVDNSLVGSVAQSWTSSGTFQMGNETGYFPGREAYGLIDDIRVYNRALSASEVAAMYNGGM